MTSVFVHALPPLLCFTLRWYPAPGAAAPPLPAHLDLAPSLGLALLGYAISNFRSPQYLPSERQLVRQPAVCSPRSAPITMGPSRLCG